MTERTVKPKSLARALLRSPLVRVGVAVMVVGMTPLLVAIAIDPEVNDPCLGLLGMTGQIGGLFLIARGAHSTISDRRRQRAATDDRTTG